MGLATVVLVAVAACGQRTLVVVEPCPDGGGVFVSCPTTSPLREGLVGLWHLDEHTGNLAADSSGQSPANDGMLVNLDDTAWVSAGILDGALETKGVGYVNVKPSASIDSIRFYVTAAAWVYLDAALPGNITELYVTALSRQLGTGKQQWYHLSLNREGKPAAFIISNQTNTSQLLLAQNAIAPMRWTHLAVTYDGARAILYADGMEVDNKAIVGVFGAETTPLILGGNGNDDMISERFPGRIDEVVLYNRALNANEIGQLFSAPPF